MICPEAVVCEQLIHCNLRQSSSWEMSITFVAKGKEPGSLPTALLMGGAIMKTRKGS